MTDQVQDQTQQPAPEAVQLKLADLVLTAQLIQICSQRGAFKAEEYWTIAGTFKHSSGKFPAQLTHIGTKKAEIKDKKTTT